MGSAAPSVDQVALRRSVLASVMLCVLALGWGLAANSQVILLDGAYMAIGVVLSGLSLVASRLLEGAPESDVQATVRRALSARLNELPSGVWLNVELTNDPRLIA